MDTPGRAVYGDFCKTKDLTKGRLSDSSVELWKKILWPTEPTIVTLQLFTEKFADLLKDP